MLVLVALALPLFSMRLAFTDAGNDPTSLTTRQAYDLLAQGFGPGFNGPLVVAAAMPGPRRQAPPSTVCSRRSPRTTTGIAFVTPPQFNEADTGAVIIVYPTTSPQSAQTEALVQTLRNDVIPPVVGGTGVDAQVGGQTAASIDAANFLGHRLFVVIGAVLILSFLLLMVVFRSLVLPLKAVIMNLLSVGRRLRRHGGGVPVGLGRAHHRHRRDGADRPLDPGGAVHRSSSASPWTTRSSCCRASGRSGCARSDNSLAVADGLAVTGRIITAAAAIMFCVFASFVIKDPLHILKVFGLGLATAVLVDATIVRMMLVPSIMEILGPGQLVDAGVDGPLDPDDRRGGHAAPAPSRSPGLTAPAPPLPPPIELPGRPVCWAPMKSDDGTHARVPQPRARRAAGRHGQLPG